MPLEEYRRKRDFADDARAGAGRPRRAQRPLHRPAAPRHRAPLRLPPRDRRRPRQLGGAEGADPRPGRAAAGDAHRGPPHRVPRLRGRHPAKRVRRRRRDRLGLGHVRAGGRDPDPATALRSGRDQVRAARRAAARPLHASSGPSGRARPRRRTASSGCSSTSATSSRSTAGMPRTTRRSVKTGRTNDEVRAGVAPRFEAPPPPPAGEIDLSAAIDGADARLHPADEGHPGRRARSTIPTGCSR